jgi:hypothetical protein
MVTVAQRVSKIKSNLRTYVTPDQILVACRDACHEWRERVLGPVITVYAFLLQILHGNTAMTHVPRLAGARFSPSAYCQARQRLPLAVLRQLLRCLAFRARRATQAKACWRGHRTFIIDGSSCSMPDTPALQHHFGQPTGQRPGCGFPVAHLLVLFDVHTGLLIDVLASSWRIHDLTRAHQLHPHLRAGDILIADRGFCSYAHIALLRRQGVQVLVRVHGQRRVSFSRGRRSTGAGIWPLRLGHNDHLTIWQKTSVPSRIISREAYHALPQQMLLRELRYRVTCRGYRTRTVTLATTLLDPQRYPAEALAELYQRRWQAEVNLRHLKQTLGMRVLHSRSVAGVEKELLAFALVYNLVCLLATAVAVQMGVEPTRVSFVDALRVLQHLGHGNAPHRLACNPYRPGRIQPRVRKRRPLQYGLLTSPREQMRAALFQKQRELN